jgi:hypothetical protein
VYIQGARWLGAGWPNCKPHAPVFFTYYLWELSVFLCSAVVIWRGAGLGPKNMLLAGWILHTDQLHGQHIPLFVGNSPLEERTRAAIRGQYCTSLNLLWHVNSSIYLDGSFLFERNYYCLICVAVDITFFYTTVSIIGENRNLWLFLKATLQ